MNRNRNRSLTTGTPSSSMIRWPDGRASRRSSSDALGAPTSWPPMVTASLVFAEGKYNGGSLAVSSIYPKLPDAAELPVVGGSEPFCMARSYVLSKTYKGTMTLLFSSWMCMHALNLLRYLPIVTCSHP